MTCANVMCLNSPMWEEAGIKRTEGQKVKVLRLCRNKTTKRVWMIHTPYYSISSQSFFYSFCSFGWVGLLLFPDLKLMMQSANGKRITCSMGKEFFFALGKWIPWRVQIYSGPKKEEIYFSFAGPVTHHLCHFHTLHNVLMRFA